MPATPLLDRGQPRRQRVREPDLVSDLRDERAAGVRHQPRSVRADFYGYRASITHHLQGEPPSSGSRTFDKPKDPCSAGRLRAPARRGRGRYEAATARSGRAACHWCGRSLTCSSVARATARRSPNWTASTSPASDTSHWNPTPSTRRSQPPKLTNREPKSAANLQQQRDATKPSYDVGFFPHIERKPGRRRISHAPRRTRAGGSMRMTGCLPTQNGFGRPTSWPSDRRQSRSWPEAVAGRDAIVSSDDCWPATAATRVAAAALLDDAVAVGQTLAFVRI